MPHQVSLNDSNHENNEIDSIPDTLCNEKENTCQKSGHFKW